MVGPLFTTPWRLVSQSHGAVAWRFRPPCPSLVPFPFASSRHRPVPSVPWTPYPVGPLCGPGHTPFPAPSPCPFIPCLYPTGPPATLWRGPTGSSSIWGPFCAPSTGRSLPAPFPSAAAPAYSLGLSCGPIPSLIPCLYPTGPPATLWRGPTGSSSIRGPFCAPSTGRSPPRPRPSLLCRLPCCPSHLGPSRGPCHSSFSVPSPCGAAGCCPRLCCPSPSLPPSFHSPCRSPFPAPAVVLSSCRRRLLPALPPRILHTFSRRSCLTLPSWIFHLGCVVSLLSRPCSSWAVFRAAGVLAPCVVLRVRRPGPPGSCSPLCTPCVWCCVHGFLGLLAPAHRRARSVCGVAGAVSWAAWSLVTGVHARCVLLRARCPGPLCSSSPVCLPRCAVSCVRCPGPLGSCSPVCTLCVRCCMCGVPGLLAPVHRCACSLCAPRLLPIPLPHPRLHLCMLSVSALLLFPAAAFSSSRRHWRLHSSLRLC